MAKALYWLIVAVSCFTLFGVEAFLTHNGSSVRLISLAAGALLIVYLLTCVVSVELDGRKD